MNKYDVLKIANDNNGYIYSQIIKKYNIPTILLTRLTREGLLTKLDRGIYISDNGVEDKLFIYSIKYSKIVYSGETALFLNELSNKQTPCLEFTIPFGTHVPKINGFNVKHTRTCNFELGLTFVKTQFGNKVRSYDMERCICDLFIRPDYYEYEDRVFAIREYANNFLNFKKLYDYAKKLNVYDEVRNVFEVIGWS